MKLVNGNLTAQERLTNPSKGAQKVAQSGPQALSAVDMHFAQAIPINTRAPIPCAHGPLSSGNAGRRCSCRIHRCTGGSLPE